MLHGGALWRLSRGPEVEAHPRLHSLGPAGLQETLSQRTRKGKSQLAELNTDFKINCLTSSWSHSASREIFCCLNCNIISGYLGLQLSQCEKHEEVTERPFPGLHLTHDSCCTRNLYSSGWGLRWCKHSKLLYHRSMGSGVGTQEDGGGSLGLVGQPGRHQAPVRDPVSKKNKKDGEWRGWCLMPATDPELLSLLLLLKKCWDYRHTPPCLAASQWLCGQPYCVYMLYCI